MRFSFITLFICLAQLSAAVYSQNGEFTIDAKNITMRALFHEIEQQSEYRFFYNDVLTNVDKEVSIEVKDKKINEVLDMVLDKNSGITYRILDNKLIVVSPVALLQQLTVTGVVTDDTNEPIPGVNIVVKGTTMGVVTDMDGRYSISVPDRNAVLVFSFVGTVTVEETVSDRTEINVLMQESSRELDEVVVIGYGSVMKKDLTGAVSVVSTEQLSKKGAGNIGTAMQGLATGVTINTTGKPDGGPSIIIRGLGNLSNNNPLWVVDGMITDAGVDFNPNDVESIQILKDASAAAIYGSRAANGVIIVTTKTGKKGPLAVDLSTRWSVDWSPRYDLMNAEEYKKYTDMAFNEGIKSGSWNRPLLNHWNNDTDWQEETMKTGLVQDYNLTLSGGSDNSNYLISGGYWNNNGLMYGNSADRYTLRINSGGSKGIFSIGESLLLSRWNRDTGRTNPYNDMLRMLPTIPVYDSNNPGGYGYGSEDNARTFGVNPIAREDLEPETHTTYRIRGSFWGEVKILEYLKYKLNLGIDYLFDDFTYFRKKGNWTMNHPDEPSVGSKTRDYAFNELVEHTIDFNRDFGRHHVDAVVGLTYSHYNRENMWAQRHDYPFVSGQWYMSLNSGTTNQTNSGNISENALISYLGRANYNYDNKYYLTLTFRRDGTSRLSKENRWENYPSISAAWRISEEDFFAVPWINDLKLRANYGELGNASIGSWDYTGLITPTIVTVFGRNQSIYSGSSQVQLVNSDLRWERTKQYNLGFDASFLQQRLSVTAEYYNSETIDVLTTMQIPWSTGSQGGNPNVNAASLLNTGFEFSANWRDRIGEVGYSIGANLTTVHNEILALGYGRPSLNSNGMYVSRIGASLGEFYTLKTDGLFRTQAEIDNYVNSRGEPIMIEGKRPQLGDVRYVNNAIDPITKKDVDPDGTPYEDDQITMAKDRHFTGTPWEKFTLGLNVAVDWKGFDFSMMWYGRFGHDVRNGALAQGHYFADVSNYIRFEPGHEPYNENPNSDFPRIIYGDQRNTRGDSDMWLEKGTYFRMTNIQLGYTFGKELLQRVGLNSLRAYVSGANLITLTGYKGIDPDFVNTDIWSRGDNGFQYPNPRSIAFGLQLSF